MLSAAEKLEALTTLGIQLNRVGDLDILLEKILREARRFVNADAGSIYLRAGDQLDFSFTQNATLQKRLPPGDKLIYSTFSIPINENSIAGFAAFSGRSLNIPDAYAMDPGLPYHFDPKFDEASGYRTRSMLTIPLLTQRNQAVGVIQVINSQDEHGEIKPFSREDEKMMSHFASIATVAIERARMTRAIILRMIRMAEMRDPKETGAHVNRVASYAVEIYEHWAKKRGMSRSAVDAPRDVLRMAAMMHDVGKVAISDTILKKPARFTPEEFEIMKHHTIHGARLFREKQSEVDEMAADVALNHHERWDGQGYPGYLPMDKEGTPYGQPGMGPGKKGDEIPLFGRIVAIADVYDALCSRRVYKPSWEESEALAVMDTERGKQFDPDLIDIFFSCHDVIRSIRMRYPDQEDIGIEEEKKLVDGI
jgi:response regulator RpfG family c-di-GMP phosphodiesterase